MCTTVQPHATGHSPVASSLTEDLDLSLRLIAAGGRIRFTDSTFVAQEAVAGIRQLIRQRARWVQGHLVAWEHVGPIQRAHIPLRVRLDLTTFLLLPAALAPIALATVQGWRVFLETLGTQSVAALVGWYLFALRVPHSPLGCYCGMASRYRARCSRRTCSRSMGSSGSSRLAEPHGASSGGSKLGEDIARRGCESATWTSGITAARASKPRDSRRFSRPPIVHAPDDRNSALRIRGVPESGG